jgi:hypothetical protein
VELIDAKYELLQRGQYEHLANVLELRVNRKKPLELYEARNAIQIARTSGADRYAAETFQKAESDLKPAEAYRARKAGLKPVTMTARQAVQTTEDARIIAVKRQDDEFQANERQAGAEREARAEPRNLKPGRQQNRRVELVISGEVIGVMIGTAIAAK